MCCFNYLLKYTDSEFIISRYVYCETVSVAVGRYCQEVLATVQL